MLKKGGKYVSNIIIEKVDEEIIKLYDIILNSLQFRVAAIPFLVLLHLKQMLLDITDGNTKFFCNIQ